MSCFPAEIYGQISSELSRCDLFSLSLVCPTAVAEANRLLYRDVDFSLLPVNLFTRDPHLKRQQDRPLNCFLRTVSNSPHLASLVHAFALRTPYQPDPDVDPSQAMRSLVNLRRLSVTSILASDIFPSFLHASTPDLEVLHAVFPLDLSFLTFVQTRPKMKWLSFGRDKMPTNVDVNSVLQGMPLLPSLTTLSVVGGAVRLVAHCSSLTHLEVRMSECQTVSSVLEALKSIGPQLISLKWYQSLFYGNDAIVQCLSSLAELTPNLRTLDVMEHFCGGWGNPPCAQYVADVNSLDLSGLWSSLDSITWKSHLSCHDHLVYWDGARLCNQAFATSSSLRRMVYTEECRVESDSYVTLSYERNESGTLESKEVGSVNGKRMMLMVA